MQKITILLLSILILCIQVSGENEYTYLENLMRNLDDSSIVHITPENLNITLKCDDCIQEVKNDPRAFSRKFEGTLPLFFNADVTVYFADYYSQIRNGWIVSSFNVTFHSDSTYARYYNCIEIIEKITPQSFSVVPTDYKYSTWYLREYGEGGIWVTSDKKSRILVQVNEGLSDGFEP